MKKNILHSFYLNKVCRVCQLTPTLSKTLCCADYLDLKMGNNKTKNTKKQPNYRDCWKL